MGSQLRRGSRLALWRNATSCVHAAPLALQARSLPAQVPISAWEKLKSDCLRRSPPPSRASQQSLELAWLQGLYKLQKSLGGGANGQVYQATDLSSSMAVLTRASLSQVSCRARASSNPRPFRIQISEAMIDMSCDPLCCADASDRPIPGGLQVLSKDSISAPRARDHEAGARGCPPWEPTAAGNGSASADGVRADCHFTKCNR